MIKKINDASPRLQQLTEEIMALKLQVGAPAREIATAGQLVTLTQRLGKSANSLVAGNVANAEVALTLGRDINQFRDLTQALLSGSDALRVSAATDTEARSRLQELLKVYGEFQNRSKALSAACRRSCKPRKPSSESCAIPRCCASK